jgi:predicted  nucleic acid-binding Zn-ribbon protein
MSDISELIALQETDLALDKTLARLAEIEESLGETEELLAAREAVAGKSAIVHELKVQQKDAEIVVDDVKMKAADIEKKLYAGTVKDPKELQNLDAELKSLREQVKRREDELLAILENVDAEETELRELQTNLDAIEGEWNANRERMTAEKTTLEPEADALKGTRETQAVDVDRRVLSLYDLLRKRRGGVAVAGIERGMCQGCRISLPVSILQRARTGNGIVQCVSCERILLNT